MSDDPERLRCWAAGTRLYRLLDHLSNRIEDEITTIEDYPFPSDPDRVRGMETEQGAVHRLSRHIDDAIKEAGACDGTGGQAPTWDTKWAALRARLANEPTDLAAARTSLNDLYGVMVALERREADIVSPGGLGLNPIPPGRY
ncbi:MAG: hypothetical protein ACRDWE_11460 [Acidimicrobiales bacterium]